MLYDKDRDRAKLEPHYSAHVLAVTRVEEK